MSDDTPRSNDDAMHKPSHKQSQQFKSPQHAEVYGRYETIYDCVDTLAGACFLIGSALFFSEATKTIGTTLFLVGSALFMARPLVHVIRDFRIAKIPVPHNDKPQAVSRHAEKHSGAYSG